MGVVLFSVATLTGCILAPATVVEESPSPLGLANTTAVPTASASPTAAATTAPTTAASASPSPTEAPAATVAPTDVPTPQPTPRPTPVPTPRPTLPPTPTPTPAPTKTGNVAVQPTPPNTTLGVYGKVTDQATGAALNNVCITVGIPGAICWGRSDINGNFAIDMVNPWAASPGQFELYFILQPYAVDHSPKQQINGVVRIDYKMHP